MGLHHHGSLPQSFGVSRTPSACRPLFAPDLLLGSDIDSEGPGVLEGPSEVATILSVYGLKGGRKTGPKPFRTRGPDERVLMSMSSTRSLVHTRGTVSTTTRVDMGVTPPTSTSSRTVSEYERGLNPTPVTFPVPTSLRLYS